MDRALGYGLRYAGSNPVGSVFGVYNAPSKKEMVSLPNKSNC